MVTIVLVAGACVVPPAGQQPEVRVEHATIPAIPLPPAASMHVRPALVEVAACAECDRDEGPDRDRFFSGRLALAALGELAAAPSGPEVDGHAGTLFVSGYFGGIQLRSVLGGIGARQDGPASPLLDLVGRVTLGGLDDSVAALQRVAASGSDARVRTTLAELAPVLALLYGYNLGYLQVALERPPPGVLSSGAAVQCVTALSCRTPGLELQGAERWDGTFERLAAPPDRRWREVSAGLTTLVDVAVPAGRSVWSSLLSGPGFSVGGYDAIVDLSGGFLQVAGVALAGAAEAAANGDPALARSSLAITAGLVAWAGSYFLGLASPLPDTALPQLRCG